jgi:hypothetical protein
MVLVHHQGSTERSRMNDENTRPRDNAAPPDALSRSELQAQVTELVARQAAISEVLRAMASSSSDLRPIFDTILDSSMRLCQAEVVTLRLREDRGFRLVGLRAYNPWQPATFAEHSLYLGQLAARKVPVHIPDLAKDEVYREGDPHVTAAVNVGGVRTFLPCADARREREGDHRSNLRIAAPRTPFH